MYKYILIRSDRVNVIFHHLVYLILSKSMTQSHKITIILKVLPQLSSPGSIFPNSLQLFNDIVLLLFFLLLFFILFYFFSPSSYFQSLWDFKSWGSSCVPVISYRRSNQFIYLYHIYIYIYIYIYRWKHQNPSLALFQFFNAPSIIPLPWAQEY